MLNAAETPRTTKDCIPAIASSGSGKGKYEDHEEIVGLWTTASYINHSCVPNCHGAFIGDMQIVRAAKDLSAGTEIENAYKSTDTVNSPAELRKLFACWGFVCDCSLCRSKKATSQVKIGQRMSVLSKLCILVGCTPVSKLSPASLSLLHEAEMTYQPGQSIKLELCGPAIQLGVGLYAQGHYGAAITAFITALEGIGFKVTAYCPPKDKKSKVSDRQFVIHEWGIPKSFTAFILKHLAKAYGKVAPELCDAVRAYAKIAYQIYFGEDVTFGSLPDMQWWGV